MVSKIKEKSIANNAITAAKFTSDVSFLTLKVSSIAYVGDDTAANTGGGDVLTVNGSGFTSNTTVYVDRTQASVVTYVSPTQLTFTSPAKPAGSYIVYLYNTDGSGSATYIPGINYSGVPAWSTTSGSLGTTYELTNFSGNVTTLSASSNSTVYYVLNSGSLPTGAVLNANTGVITGNTSVVSSPTTYNFVIEAKDQENQGTLRNFSITINPDAVTWSSPANGTTLTSYEYGSISQTLSATSVTGRGIVYTANTLPTGVSITGNTISGTPSVVGTNNSLITATSNTTNRTATRNINFQINSDVVTWSSPANETLYNITVGGSVTQALSASSAAGKSITYSANTLPAGLSISGSNVTGTPSAVANTTSLITATSATTNRSATRTLLWYAKSVAGAPTIGTATQTGTTTATVTFTAPASNGNSPITSYTAVSSPGGITGTLTQAGSGTISISGLTQNTSYTFTVYATNAAGNSVSSSASNQITTAAATPTSVVYLVVAGGAGGGGASGGRGGGGGAGGLLTSTVSVSAGTPYSITVGGGGGGSNGQNGRGSPGNPSTFYNITSTGGGGGAGNDGGGTGPGLPGGSGGGGHYDGTGGPGIGGQGYPGGPGITNPNFGSGGGGGAGGAGTGGNTTYGGPGGPGLAPGIAGPGIYYAGGGGGQIDPGSQGSGGSGIGGSGGGQNPGASYTGSGGGGNGTGGTAGAGGPGVVVIAYPTAYNALSSISPGLSYDTPAGRPGYRVYRFYGGSGPIQW